MAHGRHWYKRAGGSFVMATLAMPDSDTKWAYSAIIDMLNDRDRPLADEPGFICGFTGLSKRRWNVVRAYLLDHGHIHLTEDGRLSNPRFDREHAERAAEHTKAVEDGRRGGKKSAAIRSGQAEFDLDESANSDLSPKKQAEKPEINDAKPKDKSALAEQKPRKTANGTQPPPQAPRARQRLEDRVEEESQPSTGSSNNSLGPPILPPDLLKLHGDVCDAAGYRPTQPSNIAASLDTVRKWKDRGLDFENVVLPAIRAVVAHSRPDDRTRTLGRFEHAIAREDAKFREASKVGRPHVPTAVPLLEAPGEDERFATIRRTLLELVGPSTFVAAFNSVRFKAPPVDFGDDRVPLTIEGPAFAVGTARDNHAQTILRAAKPLGFTHVW